MVGNLSRECCGANLQGPLSPNPRSSSPEKTVSRRRPDSPEKTKEKRKSSKSSSDRNKKRKTSKDSDKDKNEESDLNSDNFKKQDRPEIFQSDIKFNKLSFETAAKICWEFDQIKEKKKMKERKSATLEKADDKLPVVEVPAGQDDARSLFCEARRLRRPPVVEMGSKVMEWYPIKWEEIIRNLPLDIYSLDDSVNSKSVELCHNL